MAERTEAKYLLRTLPYDDWLMASVVFPPKSLTQRRLRSLLELELLMEPNEKMFPSVRFTELLPWIEEKVGDRVLAAALKPIAEDEHKSYIEKCLAMHNVISERLRELSETQGEYNA